MENPIFKFFLLQGQATSTGQSVEKLDKHMVSPELLYRSLDRSIIVPEEENCPKSRLQPLFMHPTSFQLKVIFKEN